MHPLKTLCLIAVATLFTIACSPISGQLHKEALKVDFENLMGETDRYKGELVLLGGYIIETRVLPHETRMTVLQAPLGFEDRPKSKDKSKGRFILIQEGYLDPQVYEKNRAITAVGTVLGKTTENVDSHPFPILTLKAKQIYLWPKEEAYYPAYGPPYNPFWDYPFYGRPFGYPYPYGPPYQPYWYW
ncbi:MAG: Slp family lipoprotein [Desulfobacteraceae bacterium]|nr:Slp family lipoprotein [Desulfobacteraceae bacterium]